MTSLTKKDLIQKIEELEKELASLEEARKYKKRNEELLQEAFDLRQEVTQVKSKMQAIEKGYQELSKKYNEVAHIFDEHIKANDDIIEINKLFLRNSLRTQELMKLKIKAFNGEKGEQKWLLKSGILAQQLGNH